MDEAGIEAEQIGMEYVYDLIKPAFPKVQRPDLDAILKRACLIINSKKHFYVKLAADMNVWRYPMSIVRGRPSMLTQEGGERYIQFKDNNVMPPAHVLRAEVDAEQRVLDRTFSDLPMSAIIPRRWARMNPAGAAPAAPLALGNAALG